MTASSRSTTIAYGGSSLTVVGALTNSGALDIGGGGSSFSSSDSVTANSFVNSGTVGLTGNAGVFAALDVSGTLTNNGSISIGGDTEELAGTVSGTGSFSLNGANLRVRLERLGRADYQRDRRGRRAQLELAQSFAATIVGPATRSTRRTLSRPRRRTVSSRI